MIHRRHANIFKGFMAESERAYAVGFDIFEERLRFIATYFADGSYNDVTIVIAHNKSDKLCDVAEAAQRQVIPEGDLNLMIGKSRPGEQDTIGPLLF